ncbi:M56 family metallopeptidase [Calidifontibacter sp. DB0510]|uniref:M56 family metallopeptidase n=1 Tax=Metallococcus carri TaxID=1656884 RepID=A0A967B1R5_9MICO|nr:M56 family metallopeptidase [Metallococcus carri]NHN57216.1 M56 family metallopeptidase [Metallococcus carri]NOP37981.1 M56 family metallopeptidase [Calidifontibacter sp. DB2511S]
MDPVFLALLVVAFVVLAAAVPQLLPRVTALRGVPGQALLLWQAVAFAGVMSGLLVAPLALLLIARNGREIPHPHQHRVLFAIAFAVTALVLGRLLLHAHRTGMALRRTRRNHAELLDILGQENDRQVRVIEHPTPTAYCIPGRHERVVLTDSTLAQLSATQVEAVLAHERAHLRWRHDLVLEYFTVLHTVVPRWLRSDAGLVEVRLLIELMADRRAAQLVGAVPVAGALVALADGSTPPAALGAGEGASARLAQLAQTRPRPGLAALTVVAAVLVVALPVLLAALIVWS